MNKYQTNKYNNEEANFKAKVTGSFKKYLARQISIRSCKVEVLNKKTDWHQPPFWRVQSELYSG